MVAGLSILGFALYWVPLRSVHLDAMSGYGLISVLPPATLAGAAVFTVAFMLTLALDRPYRWLLTLQLAAVVISLHGLAAAIEPYARDPTAWQHAGFVEYIARTGHADVGLDARFSWPGFFALVAFAMKATGLRNIEPILHWTPVLDQLLYLLPLALILRTLRLNWRASWLAAFLFAVVDWVGQDYFSPQGFAYLLYLLFIAILVNCFREPGRPAIWLARSGHSRTYLIRDASVGEREPSPVSASHHVVLLLALLAIFAVTTASHQLTPYMILFSATGLVLVRRCTLITLPLLLGVMVVFWVSFMTVAYWKGHQSDLFSGLGNVFGNLNAGVAGRISNSGPELAAIQRGRVLIALTVLGLGFLGAVRRRLWRIDDRIPLVLMFAPFLALGLQNYGGEITLRIYFFLLAGACTLVACAFFPTPFAYRSWRAIASATAVTLLLVGGFLFVRFGNEASQRVQPEDVKALQVALDHGVPGRLVNIGWLTDEYDDMGYFPQMPWGFTHMERFDYTAVRQPATPGDTRPIVAMMRQRPDSFFVMTRVHDAYLRYNFGVSQDRLTAMRDALDHSPDLRSLYNTPEAAVYVLRHPPTDQPPPAPRRATFTIGHTPLTPVGLALVPLLLILLTAYELRRRPLPAFNPRSLLRPFPITLTILLAALATVVLERFHSLG